jgi:predicted amidohydrolase
LFMRAPLTIAVAQPMPTAESHADAVLRSGARVVVFPELSLSGYRYDAADWAQRERSRDGNA